MAGPPQILVRVIFNRRALTRRDPAPCGTTAAVKTLRRAATAFSGRRRIRYSINFRFISTRGTDGVNETVIEEKFCGLKARRQFALHVSLMTRGPAIRYWPGSARIRSPKLAKLAITPPWSMREHANVRQALACAW